MSGLNISMEESVRLEGGASGGNGTDDVPHFRLRHPLSGVISGESSSAIELLSEALIGVLHGDVGLVVLGAPAGVDPVVGSDDVGQVLVADVASDLHVLVVGVVVALGCRQRKLLIDHFSLTIAYSGLSLVPFLVQSWPLPNR